ncbi:MAG: cache and HAMP domain-containing protein, partial [Peptococcaceae bacterium]|nr:cache and HAMP domain-containing protein [Peptococcaceae bacterium]
MNQNEQMQKKKMNIATAFRKWLLLLVALAFLATTAFLWVSQTKLAEHNAVNILSLNIHDVNADIHDASDENLLNLAYQIADELNKADGITDGMLVQIAQRYDVTEINYIDQEGIIRATTYSDFLNYDMAGGEQSAAFLVLLDGENEYVQSYGPVSYDASISRKYGGVTLANGGFVQIGYDADRFQKDISKNVIGITRNRHVGKEGFLIIADENGVIVSDRNGSEGKHLDTTGILPDNAALLTGEQFKTKIYGQRSYCMYQEAEGYQIIAVMPQSEVLMSRNMAVLITVLMEILVFAALFRTTFILVRRLVVDNIHQINDSLSEITDGNLETLVDVRSHVEFEELSNDINATVNTLKKYIADEAARIDT